jgi:F420-dependent oxidoreductase-like protein
MDIRIFTEPQQGATYDQLVTLAQRGEELGYDAFFRSDHFLKMGDADGRPGPTDAWLTLGGIARETSRIRLGTLVTSGTFRLPGLLAVQVAQVDAMSNGRVELGLGAGWYDDEHRAYGVPFPALGERFERLEEQLAIVTGLWSTPDGATFSFDGTHYQLSDSPALPKPVQQPVPVVIGGYGTARTPRLAAKYAHEFNLPFPPLDYYATACDFVRNACEKIDRDPASMVWSVALVVCCGENEADIARRAKRIGREVDELRTNGAAGTPDEVAEKVRAYSAAGAQRVYLQFLDVDDLDHLAVVAERVNPQLADLPGAN